jgi:tetrahydromethanopterin S-methyltransferase subunit B
MPDFINNLINNIFGSETMAFIVVGGTILLLWLLPIPWKKLFGGLKGPLSNDNHVLKIPGFMTCVYGFLLCLLIGLSQWIFNWAQTPPGNSWAMAIILFLIAYGPGFFMPGGSKTPTNFERLWGIAGLANINVTVTAGPTWQPWFLLIWTMTSITDKRTGSIGKDDGGVQIVPSYFIFAGRRLLLPDELGEEITDVTTTRAPEVISADNVGVKIPISGDYLVVNNFKFVTPEDAERTLQGEVLASLRSTAAKFAYVDIVRMKTVVTSLVSGQEAVLVMREHDEHGDKGHIMDDKFGAPLFLKLVVPFETGVEAKIKEAIKSTSTGPLAEKVKELKKTLVENYNRGRQPGDRITQGEMEDDGVFELVYTATNLVRTALQLGVSITSIQTRNATPIDADILKAGAGIEKEKLDKVAGVIRAKGAAASAKELHAALGGEVSVKDAAFIDRVFRKLSTEQVVKGEGDAIQQLIAAILASRKV